MDKFKYLILKWQSVNPSVRHNAMYYEFGVKLGITAGTIYYVSDQGVWNESDKTIKLYNNIKTFICPYTEQLTKQIPFEFPKLPETNEISYLAKYFWNKGVITSFRFLSNIPSFIGDKTKQGMNAMLDNTEIKSLMLETVDTAGKKDTIK